MSQSMVRRDTSAWILQVWTSFGIAAVLCAGGIWSLSTKDSTDKAFLALGYFFCLFAVLALSKMIRDNRDKSVDTSGWRIAVWASFIIAGLLTGWGIFSLELSNNWERAYMGATWLFLISSSFTLAKTLRDGHEADLLDGNKQHYSE